MKAVWEGSGWTSQTRNGTRTLRTRAMTPRALGNHRGVSCDASVEFPCDGHVSVSSRGGRIMNDVYLSSPFFFSSLFFFLQHGIDFHSASSIPRRHPLSEWMIFCKGGGMAICWIAFYWFSKTREIPWCRTGGVIKLPFFFILILVFSPAMPCEVGTHTCKYLGTIHYMLCTYIHPSSSNRTRNDFLMNCRSEQYQPTCRGLEVFSS